MHTIFSLHWNLIAAIWYFGNGVLHDVFVLKNHKGKYDRELLRLLMDGHVLMLSGLLLFVAWKMLLQNVYWGSCISLIVAGFMLIYCFLIWPFLKSMVTIAISFIILVWSTMSLVNMHL